MLSNVVSAQQASSISALGIRLAGDHQKTRFIVDLTKSVKFAAFTLADPYRVVIDVPEIDFSKIETQSRFGRGLVGAFRYGLITKGKSRLVLDLTGPVLIDQAFVIKATNGQPARLVFDLIPTDRSAFLKTVGKLKSLGRFEASTVSRSLRRSNDQNRFIIVLDPGHGGIDDGALGRGNIKEKDIVLAFAKVLKKALDKLDQFEVYLTREGDEFVSLADRVEFARDKDADLMISIHADIVRQDYVRGATIYTLSETASDEVAEALAEKENWSDIIAGVELTDKTDEVASILIDLARRETKNLSINFAHTLLKGIKSQIQLNKNPLRSAGFHVLKAPDVPSILVELGYLSNARDEELLTKLEWQQKTARKFALAIQSFFQRKSYQ